MLNIAEYATYDVAMTAFLLRGFGSHAMSVGKRRRPDLDRHFVTTLGAISDHTEATTCALWDAWREGWDRECARLSARWVVTVNGRVVGDDTGERGQARSRAHVERERHPGDSSDPVDVRVVTVAEIVARRADPWRQLWHVEDQGLDRPVGTVTAITDACEYARDLNGGAAVGGRYVVLDEARRAIYSAPSVIYSADVTSNPFPRCGHRLPVDRAVCGLWLSPGTDGLRCPAHGALEHVDVRPAVLPARS